MVYRHFFGRLEIIPPLLSGRLPYTYAVGHSIAAKFTLYSAWNLPGKSLKLLNPEAFLRCNICQKCVCGHGSAPDLTVGAYSTPAGPLAGFKGPTSKRRGEGAGEGREQGGVTMGREGKMRGIQVLLIPHFKPWGSQMTRTNTSDTKPNPGSRHNVLVGPMHWFALTQWSNAVLHRTDLLEPTRSSLKSFSQDNQFNTHSTKQRTSESSPFRIEFSHK